MRQWFWWNSYISYFPSFYHEINLWGWLRLRVFYRVCHHHFRLLPFLCQPAHWWSWPICPSLWNLFTISSFIFIFFPPFSLVFFFPRHHPFQRRFFLLSSAPSASCFLWRSLFPSSLVNWPPIHSWRYLCGWAHYVSCQDVLIHPVGQKEIRLLYFSIKGVFLWEDVM